MPRYKMTIEYDGTDFVGWQRQQDGLSVQQVLEEALEKFTHVQTVVYGAGRTDAGVHAYGQVAHFDVPQPMDAFVMQGAFNALVRPYPIGVLKIEEVSDDFHARFSAKERSYIYKILNRRTPAVLDRNRVWQEGRPLDEKHMQKRRFFYWESMIFRHFGIRNVRPRALSKR